MRIAITVDPEIAVPPVYYGGIERVVEALVRGLQDRGHAVTLFANAASKAPCELVSWPGQRSGSKYDTLRNMFTLARKVSDGNYDLVHSFARLAYLLLLLPRSMQKLMTYQRYVTARSVRMGLALARGSLRFTGVSGALVAPVRHIGEWDVVYNCVPVERFEFGAQIAGDAPLVFLGRIEPIKGTHLAIEIAERAGRRLVIAGNIPAGGNAGAYFDALIRPSLRSGSVEYVGAVDDEQKAKLLKEAAALLMPVQWEEPFGIVMAEALACGTPVVGLRRGAVPEVVRDGVTGFVCDTPAEMAQAVAEIHRIDRRACRQDAEMRFSDRVIVEQYETLYRTCCAQK